MAIEVNEALAKRSMDETIDGRSVTRTYTRTWQVKETGNISLGPLTVRNAWNASTGISLFSHYATGTESDIGAKCYRISPRPISSDGQVWEVVAEFRFPIAEDFNSDPLLRPARISIGGQLYQVEAFRDRDGDAVVNSAGDPFDPPILADEATGVISVQRNLPQGDITVLDYINAVNSAPYLGFPIESLRILDLRFEGPQSENGITFWSYSASIQYKAGGTGRIGGTTVVSYAGHDLLALDKGLRKLSGGNPVNINDSEGKEVTSPVLLNGSGTPLSSPSPTGAVYMGFSYYRAIDFSLLNLI